MKWEQIKNWPWKRIVLGTAVLSSIAASTSFGTYAYFTSQVDDTAAFAAGKLEIRLGETKARFEAEDQTPFMPGVRFEKSLTIENDSDVPVKYALLAEKADGDEIVYDQLMVEIRREAEDTLLYLGRVKSLTQANIVIPELPQGGQDELRFTVYLPESTGNEVQQKSTEVNFGFLATQQENTEYFAQRGPVMTFTPEDLSGSQLIETMKMANKIAGEDGASAKRMTFILGAGTYDLSGMDLPEQITWQAAPGQEGKVIIEAGDLEVSDSAFEGIRFEGAGTGLLVGSNVSFSRCTFIGFNEAIKTAKDGHEDGDTSTYTGLTVKDSRFEGAEQAIVLDQTIKAAMIVNNRFVGANHAVVIDNDQETQVQIVDNDFVKVNKFAVMSDGVRVGDGIDGFKEIETEKDGKRKLALHLHKADIFLENNSYE
ncbi:hypothetical protein T458_14130 [Brevibacillus panacihumi W25]|uniref:Right handed beta helix domain-containing protein n=1 Tax=Brevibacillus panacihumi W25 TaxID=1408254 RepID=V6M7T0_9BACL|nr:hypothetical protein [Brevibacillus panacihumi]EST54616.1 hypothetical protein T458_14130 [Brevibacillus panacihumi W25]